MVAVWEWNGECRRSSRKQPDIAPYLPRTLKRCRPAPGESRGLGNSCASLASRRPTALTTGIRPPLPPLAHPSPPTRDQQDTIQNPCVNASVQCLYPKRSGPYIPAYEPLRSGALQYRFCISSLSTTATVIPWVTRCSGGSHGA